MNLNRKEKGIMAEGSLQGILWSKGINKIDLRKDKIYIINQVLAYGDMDEIKWLLNVYSLREVKEVFLNHPRPVYTRQVFYFIKNIILGLKAKDVDGKKYIKAMPGSSE